MNERAARWLTHGAWLVVLCASLSLLGYALLTLGTRPPDGVEGEIAFEAERIHRGAPLYVGMPDALASEASPSLPDDAPRYFVLYPPFWSGVLAVVPAAVRVAFARALALCVWMGTLAFLAFGHRSGAPRSGRWFSAPSLFAVLFVLGAFPISLYALSGRPDTLAVGLAALGLSRVVRSGRPTPLAGCLLALAAWVKPNVLGIAAGVFVLALVRDRRAFLSALVAALGLSAIVSGLLAWASHGAFIDHLLLSTLQPPSLSLFVEQMASRLPFFGAPIAFALWLGWRHRSTSGAAYATAALAASSLWGIVALAKIGSASNYWMEPAVSGVLVIALVCRRGEPLGRGPVFAGALLLQALWVGVAACRSSVEATTQARARAAALQAIRDRCILRPGDRIMADEPGIEWAVQRSVMTTPFQLTHLWLGQKATLDPWIRQLRSPKVRCFVDQSDEVERLDHFSAEHDRLPPRVRRAIAERFVFEERMAGLGLYRAGDSDIRGSEASPGRRR